MIDLSYLTEEEQKMIITVLKRDAELKKAEEERVKQLQRLLPERGKLKNMTGEWFYEAKSQRHMDRIHGSDIIRASMRPRKPMTLLDLTQSWAEKTSVVSKGNRETLLLPEPSGPIQEPPALQNNDRENDNTSPDQERLKQAVRSPGKQRHNPFNRASLLLETPRETDDWPTNGAVEPHGTTAGELLSHPKNNIGGLGDDLSSEGSSSLQGTITELAPTPKKRTILFGPPDSQLDSNSPVPRWSSWRGSHGRVAAPKGILKHSISWDSNDSGLPYDGQRQGLPSADTPKLPAAAPERESTFGGQGRMEDEILDDSLDRRQVRFSPPVSLSDATGGPELWKGREFGDQDLLDLYRLELSDRAKGVGLLGVGSQRNEGDDVFTLSLSRAVCERPAAGEGSCLATSRTVWDGPPVLPLSNEPELSWMAYVEHPPCESTPLPFSETQHCRRKGQHDSHAEPKPSQVPYLLPSVDDKSKLGYVGIGDYDVSPVLAVQSPELTEEEGGSIAKVLEWFSRSSDSSEQEMYVEANDQQEAPADDGTTNTKMVEDKDQPVTHKDDVTTINQMTEHTLSKEPPAGEVQLASLRRVLLKRSTRVEEKDVVRVEGADKDQTPTAQEIACSEFMKNEFAVSQHPARTSLKTETAYQPKRRLSTAEIKMLGEKKGKAKDDAEEHNGEVKAITFHPVTKAMQQEIKQRESRNESTPQKVTNLKSFRESPKILIGRSSMATKHCEMKKEHIPKFEANRIIEDSNVDFWKAGQEVPFRPKGTCLAAEDENETNGKYVFQARKGSCHQRDVHKKDKSVGLEDGVSEVNMWSGPLLTQQDSPERALRHSEEAEVILAPMCMEKALLPLKISDGQSLKEEDAKYIAKSVIVDEDVKVLVSLVEMKADFTDILQKEQLPPKTPPLSRCVIAVQQPSSALPVKQSPNQLDSSPGKIMHLKSFWESEKQGPKIITSKPKKELVDTKEKQIPAPRSCMSKRFTTSAFDLRMTGTDDYDNGDADLPLKQGPNFTVLSLKERWMKASMDQSPSNLQFKNLRDFWGGAPSNRQNPLQSSTEIIPLSPKSLRSKGQESNETASQKSLAADKNLYHNSNYYPNLLSKDLEKPHFRAQRTENGNLKMYITDISSSKEEPREKEHPCPVPLPRRESVSSDEVKVLGSSSIRHVAESKSAQSQLQIMMQEQQRPPHLQKNSEQAQPIEGRAFTAQRDRETRPQGPRKIHLGNTTGRVNPLRRATSMYTVNLAEVFPEHSMKTQEDPMGRKQPPSRETPERQSSGTSDDGKQPQPLARSFIPYDYQHYLGISEGAMFQLALAAQKGEETGNCFPPESELSVRSAPIRARTQMGLKEPQARMWSEGPLSHRVTDVIDLDSYRSSTPETCSYSGTSSACDDEDTHPVKKALKRAALKPVTSCKSVEDITSLPMREERSRNTTRRELMLSMDDVTMVPSFHPSSISDPAQMKKMSKSVPSFLQKESSGRDSDSTSESSFHMGRQTRMGRSLTNLSGSSGMASVSSISGSVMSIYSGDFGNVEVRGTIQFSINYVQKLKEFHIFVVRCRDLAVADLGKNRSNPYVKCYLLPEQAKLGKRKTSVKKKTLNPTFNEILRYRIRMETLKTQILNLSVWHNDTFGRNSFLGEVELDLSEWDFGSTQVNNFILRRRTQSGLQPSDYRGEMRLALRFMPQMSCSSRLSSTGEVHIWVKDCKDLPIIRGTSIDPFVKVFMLPDTSRKSRQKTRVMKRTESPAFNHTMVYDGFRAEDLPEACVELTVWDHDRLASHFVGGLRLGLGTGKSYGALVDWMDSNADEANLWERMMNSPNEWVEDVLPLRMLTKAITFWK